MEVRMSSVLSDDLARFDPAIYRKFSVDLHHLNDEQLRAHFIANPREARIFGRTETTAELLSMRWLRGVGLEVGAGGYPIKTFGSTQILQADVDTELLFGGKTLDVQVSVDDPGFPTSFGRSFDFAVASHVLEHVDGFIRAVQNLVSVVHVTGIVYLILPDIEFLNDARWMSRFEFTHHIDEYYDPMMYAGIHDMEYINGSGAGIDHPNDHAVLSEDYRDMVKTGQISAAYRFLHHKHNYKFGGWVEILEETRRFLGRGFELVESCYGRERADCHFVLRRLR
jgi:SAM-dependent methyltransferase